MDTKFFVQLQRCEIENTFTRRLFQRDFIIDHFSILMNSEILRFYV